MLVDHWARITMARSVIRVKPPHWPWMTVTGFQSPAAIKEYLVKIPIKPVKSFVKR